MLFQLALCIDLVDSTEPPYNIFLAPWYISDSSELTNLMVEP